jgi:hypothetical protein
MKLELRKDIYSEKLYLKLYQKDPDRRQCNYIDSAHTARASLSFLLF